MSVTPLGHFTVAAALMLLLMSGQVGAQPRGGTTQWLYERCTSRDTASRDNCAAFLLGVAGTMAFTGRIFETPPTGVTKELVAPLGRVGICSAWINGEILRQTFINWADKNPQELKQEMTTGAMAAFLATWPCK